MVDGANFEILQINGTSPAQEHITCEAASFGVKKTNGSKQCFCDDINYLQVEYVTV